MASAGIILRRSVIYLIIKEFILIAVRQLSLMIFVENLRGVKSVVQYVYNPFFFPRHPRNVR